jgi:radical SAM-linked protein
MSRLRVRFTKVGKIRFTSHRDVARMFERAFRRADVPLAYTEGFSPRPRISFGLALSTAYESVAEYLDADLADLESGASVDERLPLRLSAALPNGIDVVAVAPIDAHAPSLQQDVTSTSWRLTIIGADRGAVERAAHGAIEAPTIMATRTRKGQQSVDDLRPSLLALHVDSESEPSDDVAFLAELATQPRALRPAELIGAVWPTVDDVRALRTHQWIERDGARWEPLPSDAPETRFIRRETPDVRTDPERRRPAVGAAR